MPESNDYRCPLCGGNYLEEKIEYETYLGHMIRDYYMHCHTCNGQMAFDEQATKNKEEVKRVRRKCVV